MKSCCYQLTCRCFEKKKDRALTEQLSAVIAERDSLRLDVERLDNAWTECHGLGALVEREKQEALAKITTLEKDFKTSKEINRVLANANDDLVRERDKAKACLKEAKESLVKIRDDSCCDCSGYDWCNCCASEANYGLSNIAAIENYKE